MRQTNLRQLTRIAACARPLASRSASAIPGSAAAGSLPRKLVHPEKESGMIPAHHCGDGTFQNPWNSYEEKGFLDFFTKALPEWNYKLKPYALPVESPPWSVISQPREPLQALWIGHVTFLMQAGGWNILTDPQFSKRASPVQFAGPERFTPSPCTVDQLPPLHAAFISHNHYDHLDYGSVQAILAKETADLAKAKEGKGHGLPGQQPFTGTTWFVPLRVSANLISMGVRKERIVELDWWQSGQLLGTDPSISPTITAVPAQHQSARYPWDRNATLWCGFVVETPMPGAAAPVRWYFSGDTGYRSVPPGALPGSAEERSVPTCPAFREIGEKYGAIDLALLPIGAYSPRHFMSSFHASPEDAVDMHVDVRAARSIGMHWGTFLMTDEPIEEPPARLASAAKAKGLAQDAFVAIKHGQVYSPTAPGGIVRDA